MKFGIVIKNARHGAIGAALLACVLIVAASARDDASAGTSGSSASTTKSKKHSGTVSRTHSASSKRRKKSSRVRGQEKIDSERAQAIQEALIREHYLSGEATGTWNQASEEAMRRYQADHGWQSKTVPDSRALIKLGLGPSKDHLLNPESAMTTVPDAPRAQAVPTTSHTTPATSSPVQPVAPASTPAASESSSPQ
jgi:Putative peptidoglycan binding domain